MSETEIKFNFSPIKEYYAEKSILITGVTGLVGKVLLYKILKSIDTIDKVYLVIREKRNKSSSERLNELFEKSKGLFDDIDRKSLEKVVLVNASLTTVGMNLSENDRNAIINNVSIVFHSAADVTFDAKLKEQVLINVGGTKEILDLCAQLRQLDALVYVSTAYSSPIEMVVNERVYQSNKNPMEILEIARNSTNSLNASEYLGDYPNTYSYTKNLSENLVKEVFDREGLPVTIVRPGIVLNSVREPKSGWFDSINSIMGIFVLLATGLTRIVNTKRSITADVIPVDMVANTCIVSAHVLSVKKKKKLVIYNCNSSCLGALSFGFYFELFLKLIMEYPLYYTLRPINSIWSDDDLMANRFTRFINETCFAHILDLIPLLIGKQRIAVKKVRLYHSMMKATLPYLSRQWYFTNDNMIRLSQQLSDCDRNTFNCDIQAIEWVKYFRIAYFESRKLLLKEKDGDIERAQRNIKYIRTFYTIINHLLVYLVWYLLIHFTPISTLMRSAFNMFAGFDEIDFGYYLILVSAAFNSILNFL